MRKRLLALFCCAALAAPLPAAASETPVNLARGKSYTVEKGVDTSHSYALYAEGGESFDVDGGQLTDGAKDDYYKAFRALSRTVTIDLGAVCSVTGYEAAFYSTSSSGVYVPRCISMAVSQDGEQYMTVSQAARDYSIFGTPNRTSTLGDTLSSPAAARYVRIEFPVDVFCYISEIEVYGYETPQGNEQPFRADEPTAYPNALYEKYAEEIGGAGDVIKIYNGYYAPDQTLADNTADELLPYAAYLGADGSIQDTMFDAFAFVPCHGDYPSGGRLVKTNGKPGAVMSDWLLYLENTFAEGINLDALDKTVAHVNQQLGRDTPCKVFLTMPYPLTQDKPFGDIDGDGREEYTRTNDERLAVLAWYEAEYVRRFDEAGYENLTLVGFYWYREEVNSADSADEDGFTRQATALLREKGHKLLFDPFFTSAGFERWSELGFDGAVMQPNLVFNDYFETEMLEEFTEIIRKYGLGVEIETAEPGSFRSAATRDRSALLYEQYLYYGWKYGYMDTLHTFYQGAGPGSLYDFCHSNDAYMRSLYDKTYRFIKGTYEMPAPSLSVESTLSVEAGSKRVRLPVTLSCGCLFSELSISVEGGEGVLVFSPDGSSLLYTPPRDFTGEEVFTVTVSDKFSSSAPVELRIRVGEAESSAASPAESTAPTQNGGGSAALIAGITAAVVVAAAGIACFFVRKKRKGAK